ncbi:unnamed protein product [Peniophora sp. CBMAI 1063]|nr:unnamed protein product [Peniophora sp. CBMAI 1063]
MLANLKTNVFLTGATGYLGGATLQLLLKDTSLSISALVRDKDKASKLARLGVNAIVGSLEDTALLKAEAAKAEAVVQIASFGDIDAARALLRGAKNRFERTGERPVFIHTSGAGAFVKLDVMGEYSSDRVVSDADADLFDLKNTMPHNTVNDIVLAADKEGYVRTYILYPGNIYGLLKGPLVDAGIAHSYSLLSVITRAIDFCIQRRQGGMVGRGLNKWPAAHIDDAAELYKLLLERALADKAPHGDEGTFVIENGEYTYVDAANQYTKVLHAHGMSVTPEPQAFSATELETISYLFFLGTDVRLRGARARRLGWVPVHNIEEFHEGVQKDAEAVLADKP